MRTACKFQAILNAFSTASSSQSPSSQSMQTSTAGSDVEKEEAKESDLLQEPKQKSEFFTSLTLKMEVLPMLINVSVKAPLHDPTCRRPLYTIRHLRPTPFFLVGWKIYGLLLKNGLANLQVKPQHFTNRLRV